MHPLLYNITLIAAFASAAVVAIWILKWKQDWPLLERLVAAPLAGGALLFLAICAGSILQAPFFGWNGARLAQTFALVNGYPLYCPANSGAILDTIYGPVSVLIYLPATLAGSPSTALVMASAISGLLFFAPMAWLVARGGDGSLSRRIMMLAALLCFGFLAGRSAPLSYGAFSVHADAPALGFAGLACVALCLRKREEEWTLLAVSAVCAVLSVWSKQAMLLVPVTLAFCVWRMFGVTSLKRYVLVAGGAGLLLAAIFLLSFGASELFFNMVTVPGRHGWQGNRLTWLWLATQELVSQSLLPLAVIAVLALVRGRAVLASPRWLVFVAVGTLNVPLALLSRVKVGGDVSAFSPALYFWLIGALLLLADTALAEETKEPGVARVAKAVWAVLLIGLLLGTPSRLSGLYRLTKLYRFNQQEAACAILRKNAGQVYFPNNPLAHLMTEKKLYQFSFGVINRRLGGYPVSEGHFRAYLPPNLKAVLFGSLWSPTETLTHEATLSYLPGLTLQGRDQMGWVVYARQQKPQP